MTIEFFKTILVIITLGMFMLRCIVFGWFLLIFGILFLLISGFHLYAGWVFLNTISFPRPATFDLLLFSGMNFFYIFFYLVQIDFLDAPNSTRIVLEKVIGKNSLTNYLIEKNFNLMIYSLFPLLLIDIIVLVIALGR